MHIQPETIVRAKTSGTAVMIVAPADDYGPGHWRCSDGYVRHEADFDLATPAEQAQVQTELNRSRWLIEQAQRHGLFD